MESKRSSKTFKGSITPRYEIHQDNKDNRPRVSNKTMKVPNNEVDNEERTDNGENLKKGTIVIDSKEKR